jgi:hypothetical protein
MVLAMQRSATVRVLLAILGVVFLLANPAGACAGVMAGHSAPASQPAAPTVPAPGEQAEAAVLAAAPAIALESPLDVAEFFVSDEPSPEPHAILLSIHQLLL